MFFTRLQTKHLRMMALIILISVSIAACSGQEPDQPVTDISWQWMQWVETEPAAQSDIPNPENFTLILMADGSVSIQADCNMVSGFYSLDGSALSIELGMSTMAFCGEESLDQAYLGNLSSVESFTVENGSLILQLQNGAGSLTFQEG
jgi:heat shock protein HslJ